MPHPRRTDEVSGVITLRVSPEERQRLRQAAAANYQKVSDFLRDVALDAAAEQLEERPDESGSETEA